MQFLNNTLTADPNKILFHAANDFYAYSVILPSKSELSQWIEKDIELPQSDVDKLLSILEAD